MALYIYSLLFQGFLFDTSVKAKRLLQEKNKYILHLF